MPKLSVIILAHNVEEEIIPALETSKFADEIIVVDTDEGSTDKTVAVSLKRGVRIVRSPGYNFAKWRNDGAQAARGDWLLYLDSDERIPVKLAQEIRETIENPAHQAYTISRFEVFLGKHLEHWPDPRVLRLIQKSALKRWEGKVHEQPIIDGTVGDLEKQMVHLSHKNIDEKVTSTMKWSSLEAEMMLKAGHPPMAGWRFLRIMFTEFLNRFIRQGLWKDGVEGWIEAIYQMFSKFISYERLWEMQRKPSLKDAYKKIDQQVLDEWSQQK